LASSSAVFPSHGCAMACCTVRRFVWSTVSRPLRGVDTHKLKIKVSTIKYSSNKKKTLKKRKKKKKKKMGHIS
jgi:hypothetical protein